jgi:hypothetical protein
MPNEYTFRSSVTIVGSDEIFEAARKLEERGGGIFRVLFKFFESR